MHFSLRLGHGFWGMGQKVMVWIGNVLHRYMYWILGPQMVTLFWETLESRAYVKKKKSGSLGHTNPWFQFFPYVLSTMKWITSYATMSSAQVNGTKQPCTEPSETVSKIDLYSFKLFAQAIVLVTKKVKFRIQISLSVRIIKVLQHQSLKFLLCNWPSLICFIFHCFSIKKKVLYLVAKIRSSEFSE
jgi:hypothetical protein